MKLGKAFSDSVVSERHKVKRSDNEESRLWWLGMGRVLMFLTFFCVAFFILLWRLFDLTIIQGHTMRILADGNRTRELIRRAPRGLLLDRTGKPLVTNIPVQKQEISEYQRQYIDAFSLSHIVGYTGEITQKELKDEYFALHQYRAGDRIGRSGAEVVFEDQLRGRDGRELVEVDASGTILRSLGLDHEIAGTNVTLSLDTGLQSVAADNFPEGEKGAVIVSNPTTGEILALYSSPSFDINTFTRDLSENSYQALLNDTSQPMFNRTIGGVYPPGSTFKIVTALAALEEGAIKSDTTVEDVGVLTIGLFRFPNWYFQQYGKTDGIVDITKAIQRSNDIFFYKTGEWLGISKLVSWSHKIGLGSQLGIELSGEAGGLMPDPAWKKSHFNTEADREARNDEWYLGDTYHVSIGQGYLLVTPLQVNVWTNIIANKGILCRPTIEKKSSGICKDLKIKNETIQLITTGMQKACETGGTGWPLFNFTPPVACKTGTAEFGDPQNHTHAWFTAFAPLPAEASAKEGVIDPEISVTVLVEGAGEGSDVAAPIAKKIFEEWFNR